MERRHFLNILKIQHLVLSRKLGDIRSRKFTFNFKTAIIGFVIATGIAMGIFLMTLLSHMRLIIASKFQIIKIEIQLH